MEHKEQLDTAIASIAIWRKSGLELDDSNDIVFHILESNLSGIIYTLVYDRAFYSAMELFVDVECTTTINLLQTHIQNIHNIICFYSKSKRENLARDLSHLTPVDVRVKAVIDDLISAFNVKFEWD
jgi:hypothetical protein